MMMSADAPLAVHANHLGRQFGDRWAVRGVDLAVRRGEVFGLLGPNGAGKTTTVRMLTALIEPSEGTATVDGFLTETSGLYDRLPATRTRSSSSTAWRSAAAWAPRVPQLRQGLAAGARVGAAVRPAGRAGDHRQPRLDPERAADRPADPARQ
jgi:ABC-type cobalamin/Fe3+-siderophores transport system ATPase subunit